MVATEVDIVVIMLSTWEITRSNLNRVTGYCHEIYVGFFLSVCPDEREITCYIDRTTSSQNLPIIIHLPVLFEAAQHCRQAAHLIDMRSSKS